MVTAALQVRKMVRPQLAIMGAMSKARLTQQVGVQKAKQIAMIAAMVSGARKPKKSSGGGGFPWIMKKDDETTEVLTDTVLPGQHVHLPLVAVGAFAGTGFIALIAAVAFASRLWRVQRMSPSIYEQVSGTTTPAKLVAAQALSPDGASQTAPESVQPAT